MKKYYKVNIHSENIDMGNYNSSIIVEKGLIYAKEVVTDAKIMMCDNKTQESMYDYYVLSFDFKPENIARYDEVKEYIENFELSTFPVYSSLEAKKIKKIGKKKINMNRKQLLRES